MIARGRFEIKITLEDIGRLGAVLNVVDEHLHMLTPTRCIVTYTIDRRVAVPNPVTCQP